MNIENARLISLLFLTVLLTWSVVWICVSALKLKKDATQSYWWKTHLLWCIVNASIAGISLLMLFSRETFDATYVTSQKNIVLVNVFLDVIYAVIAIVFIRKAQSKFVQIGKAVIVQAMFLFFLDIIF